MKSMITNSGPTTYLDDLHNLVSNMNISTIPSVRERERYQTNYDDYEYDDDGYDFDGYDVFGYDADGYDPMGYDIDGYDRDGYDPNGYDADGTHVDDDPMNRLDGGAKINKKRYQLLLNKKKLNKNEKKELDNMLSNKYCSCVKQVKKTFKKNKSKMGLQYPICTNSIYNNRGIIPPKNKNKLC